MKHVLVMATALGALALMMSCQKQSGGVYQFELAPRTVIAQPGFSLSRNARIAADWISSPTIRILALLANARRPGWPSSIPTMVETLSAPQCG